MSPAFSSLSDAVLERYEEVYPSVLISSGGTFYSVALRKWSQLMVLDILASLKKLTYEMKILWIVTELFLKTVS